MAADRAKSIVKSGLLRSRALRLANAWLPPAAVVLRYHSIREDPRRHQGYLPGIVHSVARFEEHMRIVAEEYVPVSLDDLVGFAEGEAEIPRRAVAVTFDDGFADNLEMAAPIMNRHRIRGAVFVTVGFVEAGGTPWFARIRHAFNASAERTWPGLDGDRQFDFSQPDGRYRAFLEASGACARLTGARQEAIVQSLERRLGVGSFRVEEHMMLCWDQIRALRAQGHIVGSHTMTHPNVAHLPREELVEELTESKRLLEEKTQAPVVHFSYPRPILDPYFTDETTQAVRQAGYRTAGTCEPGTFRPGHDLLRINRVAVPQTGDEVRWLLENTFLGRRL